MKLVAISAGESSSSKTTALIAPVVAEHRGSLIELSQLSAEGLLGRIDDREVADAVATASSSDVLIVATPVYRATYTGALKAFFDRFEPDALANTAAVLCATAIAPEHYLALDTSGRALIASLRGWAVPTVVYATRNDFTDGGPSPDVLERLRSAIGEAEQIIRGRS